MPKAGKDAKRNADTSSKPARKQPYSKHNDTSQPNRPSKSHSKRGTGKESEFLSISEEILARISKPAISQSSRPAPSDTAHPAASGSRPARQDSHRVEEESRSSVREAKERAWKQQRTVEIKHSGFWQECVPSEPAIYSSLIVDISKIPVEPLPEVDSLAPKPIKFRRLCFLTKAKAPKEASEPFPVATVLTSVSRFGFRCRPGPDVDLTDSRRHFNVRHYTLKLMTIMARRPKFKIPESQMPYFLLPVRHDVDETADALDSESLIDWEEVNSFATANGRRLKLDEVVDMNRLQHIVDDGLFSYHVTDVSARFEVVALRQDLHPTEIVTSLKGVEQPILSLQPRKWQEYLEQRAIDVCDDQPIFDLEPALDLQTMTRPTTSLRTRFVIPQLIEKCHLSLSTYHALFAVPAFVQGLDTLLVARELIREYGLEETGVQLAMEAISLPTAQLGSSYERLEWYGDSCCDVVAAIYIYYAYLQHNCKILDLQAIKEKLVVNLQQSAAAERSGLVKYIRATRVHAKHWIPLNVPVGQGSAYSFFHANATRIGVKTMADVQESVVGAYVLRNGFSKVFDLFHKLRFEFDVPINFRHLNDIPPPDMTGRRTSNITEEKLKRLSQILSYAFKNKRLADFAMTHPFNLNGESELRYLMFRLGAAILHHLLAEWLFARHPERNETWLTEAHDFYNQPCHTAKIVSATGLQAIFADREEETEHSTKVSTISIHQENKYAWLLRDPEVTRTRRLDEGFKYLLATILIDSHWSWIDGPKKVFDHLCSPILLDIAIPELKSAHPRQYLEGLLRKRRCGAMEVKKSKIDKMSKVEFIWHSSNISGSIQPTKAAALEEASQAALKWFRDPANADAIATSCQCSWEEIPWE